MRKVVKAIIFNKKKFLLQLRDKNNNIFYPNHWGFFGGDVDSGEKNKVAIKRELTEELCWNPNKIQFYNKSRDNHTKCIIIHYLVAFDVFFSSLTLREGQDMKWFSIKEMNNLKLTPNNMINMLKDPKLQKMLLSF